MKNQSIKASRWFYSPTSIVVLMMVMGAVISAPVLAKSYSSRSSSSTRFKSTRAYAAPSSGWTRQSYSSKKTSVSSKFGTQYNSTFERQYSQQSAKRAYNALPNSLSSTKPRYFPAADLQRYRSSYANHAWYRQAQNSPNRWHERSQYYQTQAPMAVNGGGHSFGLLSGLFLYSLLNNNASAGQYAYHHQQDPDYQKWRTEANQLAKDNADLKAQLAAMDSVKNNQTATPINPNWLPANVPVAAVMSEEALKSSQADFKICVGSEGGAYYKIAQSLMLPALVEWVNVSPIITQGTPDILAKLASGDCDAGFIQGDAEYDAQQLEVLFTPFLEAAHLACSTSLSITKLSELADNELWIPSRSGSSLSWQRFVALNPAYQRVKLRSAVNYQDAILKATSQHACLFYMAAPHAATIDRLIDREDLRLLAMDDEKLTQSKIYQKRTLSSADYSKAIQAKGVFGDRFVATVVTPALFVMRSNWRATHADSAAKIALALTDLESHYKEAVKQ